MSDARVVHEPPLGPRMKLMGSAVVCCLHGVEKARVTQLVFDTRREQAGECPCCRNAFASDLNDPVALCHDCRPRSAAA